MRQAVTAAQSQAADVLWYGQAPPGWGGVVTKMKLLAPNVGWAMRAKHLYWTTDNGAHWKDITPPIANLNDIFFLDTERGWATIKHKGSPSGNELQLDLASTVDSGSTWSVTHVTLQLKDYGLSGDAVSSYEGGPLTFADPRHGWMNVQADGQTMNSWSNFLLVTSDGGHTWHSSPRVPILRDADALLVTPNEGWMVGDQDVRREKLYVTRDGAKSWREVSLPPPAEILPANQPAYDLPIFEDGKDGFEAVTYTGGSSVKTAAVLFATKDGGQNWTPDRILKNLEPENSGTMIRSALADSIWLTAATLSGHPMLTTLGPGARMNASIPSDTQRSGQFQTELSFISPTEGWGLVEDGTLQSTTDGGATWTTLLPGHQPQVIQSHGSVAPHQSPESSVAPVLLSNPSSSNTLNF